MHLSNVDAFGSGSKKDKQEAKRITLNKKIEDLERC